MTDVESPSQWAAITFAFLLSVFAVFFAKKAGFFRLPPTSQSFWPTFLQVIGAFFIYLLVSFILLPLVYFFFLLRGDVEWRISDLSIHSKGWLQWSALLLLFFSLLGYCAIIKREASRFIWWGEKKAHWQTAYKNFGIGIATWAASYPVVVLIGLLGGVISKWIWGKSGIEQSAVKQLMETAQFSELFVAMIIAVIFFVPLIEELLFRGFLQSWLRRKLGRNVAILLTSAIFACVHYSKDQGIGNFELILTLFILSCYIGFIYERQRTLWAPIGVHFAFNTFSVLILTFFE